jgi:flagellar biosynthetic protein FliR
VSATALLVFARCAGFAFRAPGFSHPSVPASVRAGLALLLTIVLAPSVRAPAHVSDAALLAALAAEFLIGSAIGLGASVVYDGAYAGGRAIDDYIGVKAIAPTVQLVAPSGFGRVWSLAYTGGFFLSGAYRITIAAFARGFERLPPGAFGSAPAWTSFAAALATNIVAVAIAVAGPSIALAFVVQIALGALSRAVPRFGSFTLAFPLTFGAALMMTALGAPALTGAALAPIVTVPGRP